MSRSNHGSERLNLTSVPRTKTEGISNYEIIRKLGKGASAEVWLCRKKDNGQKVAMKIIGAEFLQQKKAYKIVLNEIDLFCQLPSHRFIVEFKTAFSDLDCIFIGLEYLPGGNLLQKISRQPVQSFNKDLTRFYVAQLSLALDFLHSEGIIHRDVKPENVLLGENGYIKLTDFGLAKDLKLVGHRTKGFNGTMFYMAPEIFKDEEYSYAVDWYSLGIVMYEMLTGAPPFLGKTIMYDVVSVGKEAILDEIIYPEFLDPQARDLIGKLAAKDSKMRFSKLSQVLYHPWFIGFDWIGVILTLANAPYTRECLYGGKGAGPPPDSLGMYCPLEPEENIDTLMLSTIDELGNSQESLHLTKTGRPGTNTISDYDFFQQLGKGATAEVWLCRNKDSDQKVAMKIIGQKFLQKEEAREMILNEIDILYQLRSHQLIIDFKTALSYPDYMFIELEYLSGGNLLQKLGLQSFDKDLTRFYVAQISLALDFLQSEGIVHRDIKPENVLLSENGYIKLTDFGLAKDIKRAGHRTKGVTGTLLYMAPEIYRDQEYTYAVDWYALGIMMYEMLTGAPPFLGKTNMYEFESVAKEVLQNNIMYPELMEPEACDLIGKLTKEDSNIRLSKLSQVLYHPWFIDFDWIGVILTLASAPYTRESLYQREITKPP